MKCFISHCTDDADIMEGITVLFKGICNINIQEQNNSFFCTYKNGLSVGNELGEELNAALAECGFMIAIITDSYVRSTIALYELCSYISSGKTVIPIIYHGKIGEEFYRSITNSNLIYINSSLPDEAGKQLFEAIAAKDIRITISREDAINKCKQFFTDNYQVKTKRHYIGFNPKTDVDIFEGIWELEGYFECFQGNEKPHQSLGYLVLKKKSGCDIYAAIDCYSVTPYGNLVNVVTAICYGTAHYDQGSNQLICQLTIEQRTADNNTIYERKRFRFILNPNFDYESDNYEMVSAFETSNTRGNLTYRKII